MPFNRSTGLFARIWRFVDRFAARDEITRADLDIMADDLVSGINAALSGTMNFIGEWAAAGAFPTARPDLSRIRARDTWRVTVAGTVQGVSFAVDEFLVALQPDAGPTYAGNWLRVPTVFLPAVLAALEEIEALEASAAAAATAAGGSATSAGTSASAAAAALAQVLAIQGSLPEWRGAWQTATAYGLGDLVRSGKSSYICTIAHTSGTFSTDLGASRWAMFAEEGAAGAGTGDMLGANNLSDVVNKPAALATLGGQAANALLSAIAALGANGFVVRTGASGAAARSITGGTGIQVTNGDGVSGNPVIAVLNLTMAMIATASKRLSGSGGSGVTDDQIASAAWVREAVFGYLNVTGAAPAFAARALVNFNGMPLTGTYARVGNTVTVTMPGHGMSTGMKAGLTPTSGGATEDNFVVTVVDANTFTYTDPVSGNTSGNIRRNTFMRGWGNVLYLLDHGVGEYSVFFTTAMPDANYIVNITASDGEPRTAHIVSKTVNSVRFRTGAGSWGVFDAPEINVAVFR